MKKKTILWIIIILVGLGLLIQLVPYGWNHTNPPVASEPNWDSPQTRALAKRACFDCHSNETTWPWYANIAPVRWLLYNDVMEGRSRMNFSEWTTRYQPNVQEITGIIQEGEMPPAIYLPMHPTAQLSAAEKQQLIDGLTATLK